MTIVLTALIVCATTLGLAVLSRSRPQPTVVTPEPVSVLDERLLERVIVTLKSGTTFAGVLYAEDSGAVVLCKAEHYRDDGTKVPADGEIVLLRGDVDFIQRP